MIIVRQCALVGALVVGAQACATPVEIEDDVRTVKPSDFDTGGDDAGAQGGQSGRGGAGQGGAVQGGAGQGGAGQGGASGAGSTLGGGSGLGGQSGVGGAGTGGTGVGTGGTGIGGQGGAAGGGASGSAGTGGAGSGGAGGGSSTSFDPAACDFEDPAGCEARACQVACPTGDGGNCTTRCPQIVTCVSGTPACITEQDPLCAVRVGQTQTNNTCTTVVEPAGGANPTQATQPSFVAREFVRCICSDPRP